MVAEILKSIIVVWQQCRSSRGKRKNQNIRNYKNDGHRRRKIKLMEIIRMTVTFTEEGTKMNQNYKNDGHIHRRRK